MTIELMRQSLENTIIEVSEMGQALSKRLRGKANITKLENLSRVLNSLTRLTKEYQSLQGAKSPAEQDSQDSGSKRWGNPNL